MDASASVPVVGRKRQSSRTHTVANTSATFSRALDEVRKVRIWLCSVRYIMRSCRKQASSTPKRSKVTVKAPTQAELIARALDMEEGNIEEHRNYLTLEEEKRKKARAVRLSVQGPLVRWVSRKEEVTVLVQPPPPPPPTPPAREPTPPPVSNPYIHYRYPQPPGTPNASNPNAYSYSPSQYSPTTPAPYTPSMPPQQTPFPQWPPPPPPSYPQMPPMQSTFPSLPPPPTPASTSSTTFIATPPAPAPQVPPTPAQPPQQPPPPIEMKETVGKQYVIHEITQTEKKRPPWASTMTAMFGDHADWENLRVYTAKGRPYGELTAAC